MHIATTHTNTDCDALASLVAATFIYPDTVGILPRHLKTNVREFLALHKNLFKLRSPKDLDLGEVTRLIIVDTNDWNRLDGMQQLRDRGDLEILLWDHHMQGGNIEPSWKCHEEAGATVTLMMREIRRRDMALTPMHATLFLMGLYEDTGNLSYPSVSPEDVYTAGFLLENGADMNVASAYLGSFFDVGHTDVLTRVLESSETFSMAGYEVGLAVMPVEKGLTMLASVVTKYKEIKGVDAAFGIFCIGGDKCMVIGRGGIEGIDVGAVMRALGGGGHPGAGSAMIKGEGPEQVRSRVLELVAQEAGRPQVLVQDIMSPPGPPVSPQTRMEEASVMLDAAGLPALLVMDGEELCGLVCSAECTKAQSVSQMKAPVKVFMKRNVPCVQPDMSVRQALRLMTAAETDLLPVMADDRVTGIVAWTDLMLHIYTF